MIEQNVVCKRHSIFFSHTVACPQNGYERQIRKLHLTLHDVLTDQNWGVLGLGQELGIKQRWFDGWQKLPSFYEDNAS